MILRCCWMMRLVPLCPVGLLPLRVHPQVLLDVLLDGDPAVVDVNARAEDVDPFEDASILLQNQTDQCHCLARFRRPEEDARARRQGHTGVRGLLAGVLRLMKVKSHTSNFGTDEHAYHLFGNHCADLAAKRAAGFDSQDLQQLWRQQHKQAAEERENLPKLYSAIACALREYVHWINRQPAKNNRLKTKTLNSRESRSLFPRAQCMR